MPSSLRTLLFALGVFQAGAAVAFFFRLPVALGLWPWAATSALSYIFIASILAAAAASTLWCAVARMSGALAGIALDYVVIFAPLAAFALFSGMRRGDGGIVWFGIACLIGAAFGVGLFAWSRRRPMSKVPPMPGPVRWSFVVFVLALLAVGAQMVLGIPNILPWSVTADLSVIFGMMFLGAAAYFLSGVLIPSWENAVGQLAGFLAYDLVLIVPFVQRLPTVAPAFQTSLIIYIVVVTYSGLLAIYYLFVQPRTRILRAPSLAPAD
jgi:hypothetical protein